MRTICLVWMVLSLLVAAFAGTALRQTGKASQAFAAHDVYPEGWVEKVQAMQDPAQLKALLLESMVSEQRQDILIVQGGAMMTGLQCIILALALGHIFWGAWWLLKTRRRKEGGTTQSNAGSVPMQGAVTAG